MLYNFSDISKSGSTVLSTFTHITSFNPQNNLGNLKYYFCFTEDIEANYRRLSDFPMY